MNINTADNTLQNYTTKYIEQTFTAHTGNRYDKLYRELLSSVEEIIKLTINEAKQYDKSLEELHNNSRCRGGGASDEPSANHLSPLNIAGRQLTYLLDIFVHITLNLGKKGKIQCENRKIEFISCVKYEIWRYIDKMLYGKCYLNRN